jgi:5-dehydro-2-deoxygluconokinase
MYDLGIYPDWWKLEPSEDPNCWVRISETITRRDPLCHGILLLGLSAPEEDLLASFDAAASIPTIRGFAVGRTIFAEPARAWLAGKVDDAQAEDMLFQNFRRLFEGWKQARAAAGCRAAV